MQEFRAINDGTVACRIGIKVAHNIIVRLPDEHSDGRNITTGRAQGFRQIHRRAIVRYIQQMEGKQVGKYNIFTTVAQSATALKPLWHRGILSKTELSARLQTAIALRVAQLDERNSCLATNIIWPEGVGVGAACALAFCQGISADPREQALLNLVTKLVKGRGYNAELAVEAARRSGFPDTEIIQVVQIVEIFMNSLRASAETEAGCSTISQWLPKTAEEQPDSRRAQI